MRRMYPVWNLNVSLDGILVLEGVLLNGLVSLGSLVPLHHRVVVGISHLILEDRVVKPSIERFERGYLQGVDNEEIW